MAQAKNMADTENVADAKIMADDKILHFFFVCCHKGRINLPILFCGFVIF
jgi:hypothetical protein